MVPPGMRDRRREKLYLAALVLVFAGLGLLRADLIAGAFRATLASFSAGWGPTLKITAEILLFGAILALTFSAVPRRAEPGVDCLIVLTASFYGYLAEAWGVNSGLWRYYTGEKPPLWIIPAWPIGALVIKSLASRAGEAFGGLMEKAGAERLYWAWVIAFYCVFIPFLAGKLSAPACFPPLVLSAAVLLPGKERRGGDVLILLTGAVCVFFADLWGTTNNCWTYHTHTAYGILFGAFFDTAVVLAGIKTAGRLKSLLLT